MIIIKENVNDEITWHRHPDLKALTSQSRPSDVKLNTDHSEYMCAAIMQIFQERFLGKILE